MHLNKNSRSAQTLSCNWWNSKWKRNICTKITVLWRNSYWVCIQLYIHFDGILRFLCFWLWSTFECIVPSRMDIILLLSINTHHAHIAYTNIFVDAIWLIQDFTFYSSVRRSHCRRTLRFIVLAFNISYHIQVWKCFKWISVEERLCEITGYFFE